jgi:arylsulfatase A-like enzyme
MEHGGLGHATTAFGELVRVPLILVDPPSLEPGRRVPHLSRHLDVAPTLLALAGVPVPESFRGQSLFDPAESVYAEGGPWRAVQDGEHKLARNIETGQELVFATRDTLDATPLPGAPVAKALRQRLDRERATEAAPRTPREAATPWTPDDVEMLRALGYAEPDRP